MSSIAVSVLVTVCVFAGGVIGLNLHRVLPQSHLTKETQDAVRLTTGILSVLASLVLGLLIATAKGSFDAADQDIRAYGAQIGLLNETLRDYGSAAAGPRDALRQYTRQLLNDRWPRHGQPSPVFRNDQAGALLERAREEIRALQPADEGQRWLLGQALDIATGLLRQRWLLIEHSEGGVSGVVLAILVSWIVAIFISFGLNAPRNGTVLAAFLAGSIAIGGSVFLIQEMGHPFTGVLRTSSWPVENVLAQMTW